MIRCAMNTMEKLTELFREVFENDTITLKPELTSNDIEGWDSFTHVYLIVAIETRFKIKFDSRELLVFKNVGEMVNSIEGKLAQQVKSE
jgi:acyl carrier protein